MRGRWQADESERCDVPGLPRKEGYDVGLVSSGVLSDPSNAGVANVLGVLTGAHGYVQNSEIMATPGTSGQGNAVVGLFDGAADATGAASAMQHAVQPSQGQVTAQRSANVAWYAWQDTARTNQDVAGCTR